MNLEKNQAGKILIQHLPLLVLKILSLSYLLYLRQSFSYSGWACGYLNNGSNYTGCENTNGCMQEACVGAPEGQVPRNRCRHGSEGCSQQNVLK